MIEPTKTIAEQWLSEHFGPDGAGPVWGPSEVESLTMLLVERETAAEQRGRDKRKTIRVPEALAFAINTYVAKDRLCQNDPTTRDRITSSAMTLIAAALMEVSGQIQDHAAVRSTKGLNA